MLRWTSKSVVYGQSSGVPESWGGLRAGKHSLYEGGVRVPGMISWRWLQRVRLSICPASRATTFQPYWMYWDINFRRRRRNTTTD